MVVLFNHIFEKGIFPNDWAKSIIVLILKKGDINSPDNYRGIALTSLISKIYTYILNKRLKTWAEREEKIMEEQAGFREGYSTIDHIFTLYSVVEKFLLKNTKFYVAYVDFRKAFDSVNRKMLWNTLRKSGVNGKLYLAVRGMYDSVLACVRDKCEYSDYFECPRGVKQGCLLSPQIFSFFINELATEISMRGKHGVQLIPGAVEVFLLLFADDVVLWSSTVSGLQNQLDLLKKEADRLCLAVNLDKTKIVIFRKGGYISAHEKWSYGRSVIQVTNSYKYLGIIFTTRLSLQSAWNESCKKAKRGVIEILKTMTKLKSTDFWLFWKLFDSQIEPILTYGAELWGIYLNREMEKVHTFAMKRFLNVPIGASNTMLYGETGRYPLSTKTKVKCIKYWLRLVRLPLSRFFRQAYEMMIQQRERYDKKNWACFVKKLLAEQGFGIVWMCQGVGFEKNVYF